MRIDCSQKVGVLFCPFLLSQLNNLVQAMAVFNDYETVDGSLTSDAQTAIAPVLATAWQSKS
ncbi:hypothetical protein [Zooshikella harenae]|uniref:Uncharacterized protein n=1 Tax=Zooshikella harenae TaxID=2827238 RepID=A0ABS5ZHR3_9GAMM|nr:hypothetical protein [Zooshikella harenae]MBU2713398.1 hypothetical protein [Zooshikella harenae]